MPNAGWGWISTILVIGIGVACGMTFYQSCGHKAHASITAPASEPAAHCAYDSNSRPATACE